MPLNATGSTRSPVSSPTARIPPASIDSLGSRTPARRLPRTVVGASDDEEAPVPIHDRRGDAYGVPRGLVCFGGRLLEGQFEPVLGGNFGRRCRPAVGLDERRLTPAGRTSSARILPPLVRAVTP